MFRVIRKDTTGKPVKEAIKISFTPTYTFTAGTKARASEVNQNFTDINSASFADKGATGTFTAKQTFNAGAASDISVVPGTQPGTAVAGDFYVNSSDNHLYLYDGAAWNKIGYATEGDITAVTAGDGLSGGGSSGAVQLDVELSGTSGLSLIGTSPAKTLEVADTLAGDGLAISSKVLGLDLTASGGLTLTGTSPSKTLGITLATNSALSLSSGLAVASSIAGNGLTLTTGVLDIGAGTGISVGSDTVAVDATSNLTMTGDWNFNGGRFGLPSGGTDPVASMTDGDVFYNTASDDLKIYNGASWISVGVSATPTFTSVTVNTALYPDVNGGADVGSTTLGMGYFFLKDTSNTDVYRIEIVSGVLQATKI